MKAQGFLHSALSDKVVIRNFVYFIIFFFACSFIMTMGQAQTETPKNTEDPEFASNLEELLTAVYCYCGCTRETIKVCVCDTALAIEASFKDELTKGKSVDQIRAAYLEQYGPQFYAVMPAEGINVIAYVMPAVILVLIGGVVFVVLRRSTQSRQGAFVTSAAQGESEIQVSDDAVKQVEAELERYKREN